MVISYCSTGECWEESEVDWLISAVRAGLPSGGVGFEVEVKAVILFRATSPQMFVSFQLNPHTSPSTIDPGSAAFAAAANALSPLKPVSDEQACSSVDLLAGFRDFDIDGRYACQ